MTQPSPTVLTSESISDMPDRQAYSPPPVVREVVLMRAREQIERLLENKRNIDICIEAVVESLRLTGTSWEQIGSMLHISKQAAQKRYSRLDRTAQALGVPLNDGGPGGLATG